LAPERVARVTSECDCFSVDGGVIYLVTGK
jgi:hypothetical protein